MQGVLLETMGDEKIDLHPSAKLSNSVNEEKYIRKQLSVRSQASGRVIMWGKRSEMERVTPTAVVREDWQGAGA